MTRRSPPRSPASTPKPSRSSTAGHGSAVLGVAHRVLRDHGLAEDVLQDVFVRFWNEPERYNPDLGSLRAFLVTRGHSRAVEIVRSEEARRRRQTQHAETELDVTFDLEREVWDGVVREQLRDALGDLQSEQRRAIELAYYGGHSYREVARLLDEPEGTVKSRIRSGLNTLSSRLSEQVVIVHPSTPCSPVSYTHLRA